MEKFLFVFNTSRSLRPWTCVNGTCIETGITASAAVDIDGAQLIGLVTGTMIGNVVSRKSHPLLPHS